LAIVLNTSKRGKMELLKADQIEEKRQELTQTAVGELRERMQRADISGIGVSQVMQWLESVFETAAKVCGPDPAEPEPVPEIQLPLNCCEAILDRLMDVLGYSYSFQDSGLYYLSDVGTALGFSSASLRAALDRKLESLRDEFTKLLLEELDATRRHWCAVIILKTILADGIIHSSEKAYFKMIDTLTSDDPKTSDELIAVAKKIERLPELDLDPEIVRILMWHVVTIAMFDGEYVGEEAEFIVQAAAALHVDPARIDEIVQPVAATFMVMQTLFPKEPVSRA